MNLFRLDDNPYLAAKFQQDLHVIKQTLETVQVLANCYSFNQLTLGPKTQAGNIRKHSHIHHPISKWVKETYGNYIWTLEHGLGLSDEFFYRFGKRHFCHEFFLWCSSRSPDLVKTGNQTEQPQCFKQYPQCIVPNNPVAGYRNYYKTAKKSFDMRGKIVQATWTKREIPEWFK